MALRRGSYEALACDNPAVWRFRRVDEKQVLEVAINLSGNDVEARDSGLAYRIPAYGYVVRDVTAGKP